MMKKKIPGLDMMDMKRDIIFKHTFLNIIQEWHLNPFFSSSSSSKSFFGTSLSLTEPYDRRLLPWNIHIQHLEWHKKASKSEKKTKHFHWKHFRSLWKVRKRAIVLNWRGAVDRRRTQAMEKTFFLFFPIKFFLGDHFRKSRDEEDESRSQIFGMLSFLCPVSFPVQDSCVFFYLNWRKNYHKYLFM